MRSATAFAPASVGNVAVGFDILGFAVDCAGDEVTVSKTESPSVVIKEIADATGGPHAPDIPSQPERNTATAGLIKLHRDLRPDFGFEVTLRKGIALGSGMGGSAASAVGALTAANALLERPLTKEELLPYALAGEAAATGAVHPDNVAPCLFGGLTLVVSVEPLRCVSLPVPANVVAVLVHPRIRVDTRDARAVLAEHVSLSGHVRQSANLGGFIAGCFTGDLALIKATLEDVLVEPQRASLVPGFLEVKRAALAQGALGVSLSGSGPSVFAWTPQGPTAERVREVMVEAFGARGLEADSWVTPVSPRGARLVT